MQFSEQELQRRNKLTELRALGIDPYPAPSFPVSHYSKDILGDFTLEKADTYKDVTLAGRIMSLNDKGKVLFIKIQDSKGIIQLYVRRDDIDVDFFDKVVKHLLDLGDIIGVKGFAFI